MEKRFPAHTGLLARVGKGHGDPRGHHPSLHILSVETLLRHSITVPQQSPNVTMIMLLVLPSEKMCRDEKPLKGYLLLNTTASTEVFKIISTGPGLEIYQSLEHVSLFPREENLVANSSATIRSHQGQKPGILGLKLLCPQCRSRPAVHLRFPSSSQLTQTSVERKPTAS